MRQQHTAILSGFITAANCTTVFDTSFDREPLQFTIDGGQVIPGFEEAVVGMNPGDSKTTEVPVEKGFWASPEKYGGRGQ